MKRYSLHDVIMLYGTDKQKEAFYGGRSLSSCMIDSLKKKLELYYEDVYLEGRGGRRSFTCLGEYEKPLESNDKRVTNGRKYAEHTQAIAKHIVKYMYESYDARGHMIEMTNKNWLYNSKVIGKKFYEITSTKNKYKRNLAVQALCDDVNEVYSPVDEDDAVSVGLIRYLTNLEYNQTKKRLVSALAFLKKNYDFIDYNFNSIAVVSIENEDGTVEKDSIVLEGELYNIYLDVRIKSFNEFVEERIQFARDCNDFNYKPYKNLHILYANASNQEIQNFNDLVCSNLKKALKKYYQFHLENTKGKKSLTLKFLKDNTLEMFDKYTFDFVYQTTNVFVTDKNKLEEWYVSTDLENLNFNETQTLLLDNRNEKAVSRKAFEKYNVRNFSEKNFAFNNALKNDTAN